MEDFNPWTRGAPNPRRRTLFEESRVKSGTSSPRASPRQSHLSLGVPYSPGDILETEPGAHGAPGKFVGAHR